MKKNVDSYVIKTSFFRERNIEIKMELRERRLQEMQWTKEKENENKGQKIPCLFPQFPVVLNAACI